MVSRAEAVPKTARVLLVGCGDIGSRHLQALSTLATIGSIDIVDSRPESLGLGKSRLNGLEGKNEKISFGWHLTLASAEPQGDLCVVGTMAQARVRLIKEIVAKLGYRRFLIEKVVAQSLAEYDELLEFANHEKLAIWVNCKTRTYPFHKAMIKKFLPNEPLQFVVTAGNHGLVTNGIHSVDLFVNYDRCTEIKPRSVAIDPILHKLKRGIDLYDLSGSIQAISEKGSSLSLHFSKDNQASDVYLVSSASQRFLLDQSNRLAFEADEKTGWTWRALPFEGNLMVSNMTKTFAHDILSSGRCDLPTIQNCYLAHKFLFNVLHPVFNSLRGAAATLPVT